MEKLDVIIVGAGLAGLACAYRLAETGMQVIVLERGDAPGAKNVSGGRLYLLPLREMTGDMLEGAPFERRVVRERWSLLGESQSLGIDLTGNRFREEMHSATVLRSKLDGWLAGRLMEKGIFVIPKYRVDELIVNNGSVEGVKANEEELYANVVVAADGVLSFIGEKAGLRGRMDPKSYAVGIKEIIELPAERIEDRFNLDKGEGAAHLFIGDVTKGCFGGGFVYTNESTISLGVVVGIKALMDNPDSVKAHELLDAFKDRYELQRYIGGGKVAEYSAHLIPEAGFDGLPAVYGSGLLLAGDAAGLALNMGVTVRGMEFAIASGVLAAETIIQAKEANDFSAQSLKVYDEKLRASFVIKDMVSAREMPRFLENPRLFDLYPKTFPRFLEDIMWFGNEPRERLWDTVKKGLKSAGLLGLGGIKELLTIRRI